VLLYFSTDWIVTSELMKISDFEVRYYVQLLRKYAKY
jgi:hypothetical protein